MDKEKRITTIVLDKEAGRKARIIAEFEGKSMSAVYREALDAYFKQFIFDDLLPEIGKIERGFKRYNLKLPDVYNLVKDGKSAEAAIQIAEAVRRIPQEPEAQELIQDCVRLIGILSK